MKSNSSLFKGDFAEFLSELKIFLLKTGNMANKKIYFLFVVLFVKII
jgi:hypothetical protein